VIFAFGHGRDLRFEVKITIMIVIEGCNNSCEAIAVLESEE